MKGSHILYVEDDEIEVMKFIHTMNKYFDKGEIKIAHDGVQALDILHKNRPNLPKLIVLDINMPNMNGLELLEKIKQDNDFKRIPVIMLTTSDNQKDVDDSYKHSVAGYFVKPFESETYKEILKKIYEYWDTSVTLD